MKVGKLKFAVSWFKCQYPGQNRGYPAKIGGYPAKKVFPVSKRVTLQLIKRRPFTHLKIHLIS